MRWGKVLMVTCRPRTSVMYIGKLEAARTAGKEPTSTAYMVNRTATRRARRTLPSVCWPSLYHCASGQVVGSEWRKRCHTEVGAPAKQDNGSLVVRNMSRRPRTETSTLVFGPVVTALLQVYRITTKPTSGECAAHTPTPALLPRSRTAPFPS